MCAAVLGLAALLLGFGGTRCTREASRSRKIMKDLRPQILEFDNIAGYRLDVDPKTGVPSRISGFCFRSMYCVSSISTETNGDDVTVLVQIEICRKKGQSGGFSYPLRLADSIERLTFGRKRNVLWMRKTGDSGPPAAHK